MQAITPILHALARRFVALPPGAKLLALLAPVVAGVLLSAALKDRAPAFEPLGLDPSISTQDRAATVRYLQAQGIEHQVKGADILVRADRKLAVLAELAESQVIGPGQIDFNTVMADDSPFRSQYQNRQRFLVAKMNMLGAMISQMSGIQRATVVLDQPEAMTGIGSARVEASASVNVWTAEGELTPEQVTAIAHLVARSHAGLKPQNVVVIDSRSGRALYAHDSHGYADLMIARTQAEQRLKALLEETLNYIPGVRIAVTAHVEATGTDQSISILDAGAVERALADAAGAAAGRNAIRTSATIGVPRSYFIHLHQQQAAPSEFGDDQEIDRLIEQETARIASSVGPLVSVAGPEAAASTAVAVTVIPDAFVLAESVEPPPDWVGALQGAVYTALGGGAVLGLVLGIVLLRRNRARTALVTHPAPPAIDRWTTEPLDRFPNGHGSLISRQAIRRTQMLHELTEMIERAAEVEAQFVRRWIESHT